MDYALNVVLKQKEEKNLSSRYVLIVVLCTVSLWSLVLIFSYRDLRKKKRETSESILVKEEMIEELEQRLNDSFEEILQMAKNNDPQFWTRFQEVYPNFS